MAFLPEKVIAGKLEKGFEALNIHDYFKARQLFQEVVAKKKNAYACYGLSVIFSRQNNPFSDADSASKYIHLSFNYFKRQPEPKILSGFIVDSLNILKLAELISDKQFSRAVKINSVATYDQFLRTNYLARHKTRDEAVDNRDELEFNQLLRLSNSDSTREFIVTHPQSNWIPEANVLKDKQIFEEISVSQTPKSYLFFLRKYPGNVMVNTAYEKLFEAYRKLSDTDGLSVFVKEFPNAPQNLEAWKLLFSLKVKSYSYSELKKFLVDYPNFPLKNSILKELELNKLELFPCRKGDFMGFIDNKGKFVISPVFDTVTVFSEGLSVVHINDSAYFINKENNNPFNKVFAEVYPFKNGLAPVKQNNKWFFINRLGQVVSKNHDEINELSNQAYIIVKEGKYGAVNHFGQTILEPKFDKLGDFKNEYAYYTEKGKYGFVSKSGTIHKAEFEWISDFNESGLAIYKQNSKYGLVNSNGKKVLEALYDQILKTEYPVFIIVQNDNYGFYSYDGCFITQVAYTFSRQLPITDYTNGAWFRLIKKGEHAFVDINGKVHVNFGTYSEIYFPSDGLMRVKQKKKYCYLDKKLNTVIACKFSQAEDFQDSLAQVMVKDMFYMINRSGKTVFSSELPLERLSPRYLFSVDETITIYDKKGTLLFTEVKHIQKINKGVFAVTLANEEIRLLYD